MLSGKHGGDMADVKSEETRAREGIELVASSEDVLEAIGHAYEGTMELLLAILLELRKANEARADA
jgi:hypothetical protein